MEAGGPKSARGPSRDRPGSGMGSTSPVLGGRSAGPPSREMGSVSPVFGARSTSGTGRGGGDGGKANKMQDAARQLEMMKAKTADRRRKKEEMKKKKMQKKAEQNEAFDNRMKVFMALIQKMEPMFKVCFLFLILLFILIFLQSFYGCFFIFNFFF